MKLSPGCTAMLVLGVTGAVVYAQTAAPSPPPTAPVVVTAKPAIPDRAALEKEFAESLTDAVLSGTWQMTGAGGLKGNESLTEAKPDEYAISKVTKLNDDMWVIHAKIGFAKNDLVVPVPVRVVWAEDTAIVTLNDLAVPMIGTYSARVMFHHGFYSGVWYSNEKNYGGVMQGRILRKAAESPEKSATESTKPASPSGDRKE